MSDIKIVDIPTIKHVPLSIAKAIVRDVQKLPLQLGDDGGSLFGDVVDFLKTHDVVLADSWPFILILKGQNENKR